LTFFLPGTLTWHAEFHANQVRASDLASIRLAFGGSSKGGLKRTHGTFPICEPAQTSTVAALLVYPVPYYFTYSVSKYRTPSSPNSFCAPSIS
jgi:hypothetical protein